MRLVKFLAHAGVASRRAAEVLIGAGRVSVGGEVVTNPATDVDATSDVTVDGRAIEPEPREVHALNKPAGVVSTANIVMVCSFPESKTWKSLCLSPATA